METFGTRIVRIMAVVTLAAACGAPPAIAQETKRQYWATILVRTVDDALLRGLDAAVARGEVGWLDVEPRYPVPRMGRGVNLIFYHVGGNCYVGADCGRYPASRPTGDRWGDDERSLDLEDRKVRDILVADFVGLVRKADRIAPPGAIVGVHVDNVHRLRAEGLAILFTEFLTAVETARREGSIAKDRRVGYVAKNNAAEFRRALRDKLILTPPLYHILENAKLDPHGELDVRARTVAEIGRRCSIPVFLKTFGSDVAYTAATGEEVKVSPEMAARMAQKPDIAGVAWSRDEGSYRPILYAQGAPVRQLAPGAAHVCE